MLIGSQRVCTLKDGAVFGEIAVPQTRSNPGGGNQRRPALGFGVRFREGTGPEWFGFLGRHYWYHLARIQQIGPFFGVIRLGLRDFTSDEHVGLVSTEQEVLLCAGAQG